MLHLKGIMSDSRQIEMFFDFESVEDEEGDMVIYNIAIDAWYLTPRPRRFTKGELEVHWQELEQKAFDYIIEHDYQDHPGS